MHTAKLGFARVSMKRNSAELNSIIQEICPRNDDSSMKLPRIKARCLSYRRSRVEVRELMGNYLPRIKRRHRSHFNDRVNVFRGKSSIRARIPVSYRPLCRR